MDTSSIEQNATMKTWFDQYIGQLRADEIMLETNTAPLRKKNFYQAIIGGEENKIHAMGRYASSIHFIKGLVTDFIEELNSREKVPSKLAMELSDSKVLVWAVIKDDDENTEDALILSEAKVNAKYYEYGFHISTTIVEEGDNLPIPSHYQNVLAN